MDVDLTNEERATILIALKRYLVTIRHEYQEAVEIGDPMTSHLRERRDITIGLIKTLDPEGPTP